MKKKSSIPQDQIFSPLEIRGSVLARNTAWNFLGLALPLLVGFLTIPVVIRRLGTDRFGVLSLVWVVVGYFGFFDLGLGRATTKFVAEALGKAEYDKVPKYFWTTVFIQAGLGILGAVVLTLITPLLVYRVLNISPGLAREATFSFYVMAGSFPIVLVSGSFRGMLEASQRFDLVNYVKIPSSIVNYIAPLAGLMLGFGLPGIMILLLVSRMASLVAWALIGLNVFPALRQGLAIHKETIKPMLSFGGWLTVSNLISPFLVYLERFFIGSILTMEALGYYSAPYEVVLRLGIIPQSLLMTLFPSFSALDGSKNLEKAKLIFGRSVKYLLLSLGTGTVLLLCFARLFLKLWLGDSFAQNSTLVFQILAVGFFVNSLANVPFSFLQGIGRADITAKFHGLEVVFYVPLAWGLIKIWGINGAAAAWAIRVTVDMLLLFGAAWKIGKMDMSNLAQNGVVRGAVALSFYAIAGYGVLRLSWGISGVIVLTLGFLVILWFYAFSQDERSWVLNKSREVFKKLPTH
jgi:O-antigen/teichoic acid export membrane protein